MMMIVALLLLVVWAQDDAVRLRSGKTIVGRITERTQSGLTIEKWDGSGRITIRWQQLFDEDVRRLRPPELTRVEPVLEGVRVVTEFRILEGLVVGEDEETLPGDETRRQAGAAPARADPASRRGVFPPGRNRPAPSGCRGPKGSRRDRQTR